MASRIRNQTYNQPDLQPCLNPRGPDPAHHTHCMHETSFSFPGSVSRALPPLRFPDLSFTLFRARKTARHGHGKNQELRSSHRYNDINLEDLPRDTGADPLFWEGVAGVKVDVVGHMWGI